MSRQYNVPTVDVGNATLVLMYKVRPDISRLYCDAANPNPATGQPWCAGWPETKPGTALQVAIMKDWWVNAAGQDDLPSLFRNSMAEWGLAQGVVDPGIAAERGVSPSAELAGSASAGVDTGGGLLDTLGTTQSKLTALLAATVVIILFVGSEKEFRKLTYRAADTRGRVYQEGEPDISPGRSGTGARSSKVSVS